MKITLNTHLSFQSTVKAPLYRAVEFLLPATGAHYKITEIAGKTLKGEQLQSGEPVWKTALKTVACIVAFPLALALLAIKVHTARTYRFEPIRQDQATAKASSANEIKNIPNDAYITSPEDLEQTAGQINVNQIPRRDKYPETPEEFLELQSLPSTKNILHRMIAETGDVKDIVDQKVRCVIKSMLRITPSGNKGCFYYADAFDLLHPQSAPEEVFTHFLGTWLAKKEEQNGPFFLSYGSGEHARLLVFERGIDPMDITCVNIDSFGSDSLPEEIKQWCTRCFRAMRFEHSNLRQQTDGHKCYTWSLLNMFHLIRHLPASPKQLVRESNLATINDLEAFQRAFVAEHKRIHPEIQTLEPWD